MKRVWIILPIGLLGISCVFWEDALAFYASWSEGQRNLMWGGLFFGVIGLVFALMEWWGRDCHNRLMRRGTASEAQVTRLDDWGAAEGSTIVTVALMIDGRRLTLSSPTTQGFAKGLRIGDRIEVRYDVEDIKRGRYKRFPGRPPWLFLANSMPARGASGA